MDTPLIGQRQQLDLAVAARTLASSCTQGVLTTLDRQDGWPYGSLVELAPLPETGQACLLLSTLADHTQNILQDPRVSLLLTPPWPDPEPLARPRVSILGTLARADDEAKPSLAQRYLEVHPQAQGYIQFKDFHLYMLVVERVRFIAGFGRMGWLDAAQYSDAQPDPLASAAAGIIAHMNDDHEHNMIQYAQAFGELPWVAHARMVAIDSLGFDLFVSSADKLKTQTLSFGFTAAASSPQLARKQLVQLAQEARQRLDTSDTSDLAT